MLCTLLSSDGAALALRHQAPVKSVILDCDLAVRQSCCVHHYESGAVRTVIPPDME